MIIVIRMRGRVGVNRDIEATLQRLRLKKKFTAAIVPETKEIEGMLKKALQYIAFGKVDKETLKELILKRGRIQGELQVNAKDITDKIIADMLEGKTKLASHGIKPFFRLHPPVKGIKNSRLLYPRGILGKNDKINELVRRML